MFRVDIIIGFLIIFGKENERSNKGAVSKAVCSEQFFLKVSPESFTLVVKILNRNKQDRMAIIIVRQGKNDPQVFV